MSAQGGTLARRGAVHVPIWPVATLLGAAIVASIGLSVLGATQGGIVTSVTDSERFANSAASVREQGATLPFEEPLVNPGMWTTTAAEAYLARLATIENSTAAVREMGATLPYEGVNPGTWTQAQAEAYVDSLVIHAVGLENPGAYGISQVTEGTYAVGLENPAAYAGDFTPTMGGHVPAGAAQAGPEPIVINGEICGQCR